MLSHIVLKLTSAAYRYTWRMPVFLLNCTDLLWSKDSQEIAHHMSGMIRNLHNINHGICSSSLHRLPDIRDHCIRDHTIYSRGRGRARLSVCSEQT